MSKLLLGLTDAQKSAVLHLDGPLLILAGPGSGKTRVVTHRIAHLVEQGVPSHQILALTFTNKAAEEMNRRVARMVPNCRVWVGTFHRFCSRLLRQYASMVGLTENFTIYDTEDSQKTVKVAVEELDLKVVHYTPNQVLQAISHAKNGLMGPDAFAERAHDPFRELVARVYPRYQQRLLQSNAVDFDDLLMHVANLIKLNPEIRQELDHRFRYVLVDEYQDTNLAQYVIVRGISVDFPNLAVTGDPDQSIYGWRGANIKNILGFERDYPDTKIVKLEQNYRSTPSILRAADCLISNNRQRKEKHLFTDRAEGDPVTLYRYDTGHDEATEIARQIALQVELQQRKPQDFAILYRINALSRQIEQALRAEGLPYQIVNGVEFYQRKEIKDVLAYLHLVNNPRNDLAFLRIINAPPRGIGKTTIKRLQLFAKENRLSLLDAATRCQSIGTISTRIRKMITLFIEQFQQIADARFQSIEEIVGLTLTLTGYADHLERSHLEEDRQRLENVQELLSDARQFDQDAERSGHDAATLEAFLERTSLVNDIDGWESDGDCVTLMTLHAAKGLEFPVVYMVAVEHGILPHERSREDPKQEEEERRLAFVGMTRAKDRLQISFAGNRNFRGMQRSAIPSGFLMELPRNEMNIQPDWLRQQSLGEDRDDLNQTDPSEWQELPVPSDPPDPTDRSIRQGHFAASSSTLPRMKTLAEMMNHQTADTPTSVDPEVFQVGMLVFHPTHGLGKLVALGGRGNLRTATIRFVQPPTQEKITLADSQLRPVKP